MVFVPGAGELVQQCAEYSRIADRAMTDMTGRLSRIHAVEIGPDKRRDAEGAEKRRGANSFLNTLFSELSGHRKTLRPSAFSASLRLSCLKPAAWMWLREGMPQERHATE